VIEGDAPMPSSSRRIEITRAASVSPALITKASKPGNGQNESTAERILALEGRPLN
jgi:hypothetical protein